MRKRKQKINRRHALAVILICAFMVVSIRFPIQFVGRLYEWTGILYLTIGLSVIAYAVWLFLHRRMKILAATALVITLLTTTSIVMEFERSDVYDCEPESRISLTCRLRYTINDYVFPDGYVKYLVVDRFPLGIQIDHQAWDPFILF